MLSFALSILALSASALAVSPVVPVEYAAVEERQFGAPPIPAQDSFYTGTFGFQYQPNGAVLKWRIVQTAYLNDSLSIAYQVLYKTSSWNGSAIATVASIYVPKNAYNDRFMVENLFEDAVSTTCAPSYSLRSGASKVNVVQTVPGALDINRFLGQRWITVSPDYEGPGSTFAAARNEGRAVLDAARAALNFGLLGLGRNAQIGINGYSGGAFASGWAAALKNSYAPELNVVGVAQGGTPANATATLLYLDGGIFAGFGFAAVAGLLEAYQALSTLYNRLATAEARTAFTGFATPSTTCTLEILLGFIGKRVLTTEYQADGPALLYEPYIQNVITPTLTLGNNRSEIPTIPLLVYHGALDEIIPIDPVKKMVNTYCSNGARVNFTVLNFSDHILGAVALDPTPFFQDRFAGKPVPNGCTFSGNTSAITSTTQQLSWSADPAKVARTNAMLSLSASQRQSTFKTYLGL